MTSAHPEAYHQLRDEVRRIFSAALCAAEPGRLTALRLSLESRTVLVDGAPFPLGKSGRVVLLAAGKAAAPMMGTAMEILGPLASVGLAVVRDKPGSTVGPLPLMTAGHPVPDEKSLAAAERMLELARAAGPGDLVLCLFSGGASSLLAAPAPPLDLVQLRRTTGLLVRSGVDIHKINCVRKHLSAIKGGLLARAARPASLATLLLSDVVGNNPEVIASGPTVPDSSSFADAMEVLEEHDLLDRVPRSITRRLQDGADGRIADTPGPDDHCFRGSIVRIAGSSNDALQGAAAEAARLGCRTAIRPGAVVGEANQAAALICSEAISAAGRDSDTIFCRLSAGETTVTLPRQHGLGGRNMELALAAAPLLAEHPGMLLLSAGTDGSDGPTDAAGAIADSRTLARAEAAGLNYCSALEHHDSYRFFQALGDLVVTGPTQTNVMDLQLILVDPNRVEK